MNIKFEKSSVFCGISEVLTTCWSYPWLTGWRINALSEATPLQKGKVIWEGLLMSNIIQFEKHYASAAG
jgi:hypothetical protein